MHVDFWQALGVVSGALIAVMTLIGLVYRWVLRPVWQLIRRLNEVADDILGEPARLDRAARPSLAARVAALTAASQSTTAMTQMTAQTLTQVADQVQQQGHRLDEHLTWHSGGGRASRNGPRPVVPDTARRETP
jgi:hypothetical protein